MRAVAAVVILWAGTSAPAIATECVESPFYGVAGIVEGRISAVKQTSRRLLFWGSNDWEVQVVSIRPVAGNVSPRQFTYYASDYSDFCTTGAARPRIGQVRLFAVKKPWKYSRRANAYQANLAMTWSEYRRLQTLFDPLAYADD